MVFRSKSARSRHPGVKLDSIMSDEKPREEMRYANGTVEAVLRPEGYLEVVVAEHRSLDWDECRKIATWLHQNGVNEVRVLVTRSHSYALPPDYFVHDLSAGEDLGVVVRRVAYFAPLPTAQTLSHVVGETAMRHVPHEVFADRDRALAWLLADGATGA